MKQIKTTLIIALAIYSIITTIENIKLTKENIELRNK